MMRLVGMMAVTGMLIIPRVATATVCSCRDVGPREALPASTFAVLVQVAAVRTIDSFVDSTSAPPLPGRASPEVYRFHLSETG